MTELRAHSLSGEALDLLLAHRNDFLSFLEKRVGSRAMVEDILQAAFVRGIERGSAIRDEESVIAWFYRVLRNAVIDHYRHQAYSSQAMQEFAHEMAGAEQPSPELRNEICGCVSRLLNDLKPEYRAALEVVDIGEGTPADLAVQAGISANNATVRVHRARQALRKRVKITCGTCAEHGCLDCGCKK